MTGWYCCWPPFCSALHQPEWTLFLHAALDYADFGMQPIDLLPGHEVPGKKHVTQFGHAPTQALESPT